jgi:hypothetical protein
MAIEVSLELVHDVNFLNTLISLSADGGIEQNSGHIPQ